MGIHVGAPCQGEAMIPLEPIWQEVSLPLSGSEQDESSLQKHDDRGLGGDEVEQEEGFVPGLAQQIQQLAATRIQAAFRGHSERRLLKAAPAATSQAHCSTKGRSSTSISSPSRDKRHSGHTSVKNRPSPSTKAHTTSGAVTPCLVLDDLVKPASKHTQKAAMHIQRVFRGHAVRQGLQQSISYGKL